MTCFAMGAGKVGRLKSTWRFYVMNFPFWNLPRQTFPLYQPPIFLYIKEILVSAKMG